MPGHAISLRTAGALVLAWTLGDAQAAAPGDWIAFSSAPAPGAAPGPGSPVRAFVAAPPDAARAPGVVLVHGCAGPRGFHQAWARALAERGFVAVLPDSHFSHHRPRACAGERAGERTERVRDALGALLHLARRPDVDRRRLSILGWDDAPIDELRARSGGAAPHPPAVRAAVAIVPRCPQLAGDARRRTPEPGAGPTVPMLVVGAIGCPAGAGPDGAVEHALPGADPGFDDPDARGGRAGRRYDASTHASAIEAVARFLHTYTAAAGDQRAPWRASEPEPLAAPAGARWLIEPEAPGPDLPVSGASLFDRLFSEGGPDGPRHAVPYPFTALRARLYAAYPEASASAPAWSTTLIPYGRSLQRHAAAPDYADSPRIVVAATGDPGPGATVDARDRLYIAYQPRAAALEIISFNDEAGRFEFQVVSDYRSGAAPRVGYARRAVCVSCHQNQAPIFPEAAWDETNANPRVVRRLAALGDRFEGVPINGLGPSAAAIDNSTDRASLLSAVQPLWRAGCAAGAGPGEAARCRAGAALAMFQYRLSAASGFDRELPLVGEAFLAHLARGWEQLWPGGALVPDAGIPNRDPLLSPEPASVAGMLDPLRPRAPAAVWTRAEGPATDALVSQLGAALPTDALVRVDARLAELAAARGAGTRELIAPCTFVRRGVAGRPAHVRVSCAGEAFALEASVTEAGTRARDGAVTWLDVAGTRYTDVSAAGEVTLADGRALTTLALAQARRPERLRLRDGTAVQALVFERPAPETRGRRAGRARLVLLDDFAPLVAALEGLAARSGPDGALGAGPFRARRLTDEVLGALGAQTDGERCCGQHEAPPPALAEEVGPGLLAALSDGGPVRTFARYCGGCHATRGGSPPGFLSGTPREVRAGLARCAPRILHRLEAWRAAPEIRGRSPMPPPAGLRLAGVSRADWTASDDLASLRAYVSRGLADVGLDPAAVLSSPYDAQPSCGPG